MSASGIRNFIAHDKLASFPTTPHEGLARDSLCHLCTAGVLSNKAISRLKLACRGFHAALSSEELWRLFCLKSGRLGAFDGHSWQSTGLEREVVTRQPLLKKQKKQQQDDDGGGGGGGEIQQQKRSDDPPQGRGGIQRRRKGLTHADFTTLFDVPGRPCILEDAFDTPKSKAGEAEEERWSDGWLLKACGHKPLNLNGVRITETIRAVAEMRLDTFLCYRDRAPRDGEALVVFEKVPALIL